MPLSCRRWSGADDTQSSGGETTTTVALGESMSDDGSMSDNGSMSDSDSISDGTETDATAGGDAMEDSDDGESGSGVSGSGFGVVAALLTVLAAEPVALQRRA